MQIKQHWEAVYLTKQSTELSWYQPHAEESVKIIQEQNIPESASIIDVGGGSSTLVDDLLEKGFRNITVLDISGSALETAKARLGEKGETVRWLELNVLDSRLPGLHYEVWHDRAVFHFLTSKADRVAYVQSVLHALKPGGLVIVATFAKDGPSRCSGLPVMQYDAEGIHEEFGDSFEMVGHDRSLHQTPTGKEQKFVYCFCRKAEK